MNKGLEREVLSRARGLCEYCHSQQIFQPERFQVDHIIARQHRGETTTENLALCCLECNLRKGPNLTSIDPQSGQVALLFHPRRDVWNEHFVWKGPILIGLTPAARTTIALLEINRSPRVLVRQSLIEEGVFPPVDDAQNP